MVDWEICAERLREIAVNTGRPQDDTNGLVRRFARAAHDPSEVSSLQEHRQRELGKLQTTGVFKVLGQEAL
jgi:hypothetical protein